MEELKFRLEVFEGPLDLLLTLINKNKVDIYDIPIALILDQYLESIDQMRQMDAEVASEFIIMAAELMLIKSRMLLPKPVAEGEEDPRAALVRALAEYKRAKEAASLLGERYGVFSGRLAKDTQMFGPDREPPEGLDVTLLTDAFHRIATRVKITPVSLNEESERSISGLFAGRVVPISERIIGVMRIMNRRGSMTFEEVLMTSRSRSELIATFVAILELLRAQRITIVADDGEEITLVLDKSHKKSGE